jgi:outer membrane protein OmpA-like peptidoglycan-associated protein
MRRVILTAFGIGVGLGCATEQHARREEEEKENKAKPTQVVVVQTRKHDEATALAEQERRRQAEARLREATRRATEARMRAELEAERARRLKLEREQEAERAQEAKLRAQQADRELEAARSAQAQLAQELEAERARSRVREEARASEERARLDAEERARSALEQVANVRQEARGLVVTLAAPVLFAFDDATLLSSAKQRLDAIADALRASGSEIFLVEGHTDAKGSDSYNIDLSRRRAEAVRSYFLSRGVPPEQIRAYGYGEHRPVASNASPEGRANNRRVEIILPGFGRGGSGAAEENASRQ